MTGLHSATGNEFTKDAPFNPAQAICVAGIMIANTGLLLTITGFALLKEDPMFWRNAGGWPIWLRDLVKVTFYPLFAGEMGVLLLLSSLALCSPMLAQWRRPVWLITGLMWFWTGSVVLFVCGNNLTNLLSGRPLHWHPL